MTTRCHHRLGAFGLTAILAVLSGGTLIREYAPAVRLRPPNISAPVAVNDRVVALINGERAAVGLPALVSDDRITVAATGQSQDQARRQSMTHTGSDGSDAGRRLVVARFDWSAWAENVAAGQTTIEEVVAAWMASPPHRANILSPSRTTVYFLRSTIKTKD